MTRQARINRNLTEREDSALERLFDNTLRALAPDWPEPIKNYRFDLPHSRMEIDRFWPDAQIGIEINGGTWARGNSGHSSGRGIERDYRKLAAAHRQGIKLFFFSTSMLQTDPIWCIDQLRQFVEPLPMDEKPEE